MRAEEFRLHKKYSWDGSGLVMIDEFGNPISYQEFAEAYADEKNKELRDLLGVAIPTQDLKPHQRKEWWDRVEKLDLD